MLYASEDFDQRRFPSPIFTHQGMDLCFSQREIYALKGDNTGKGFGDAFHGDKILSFSHIYHLL